MTSLELEARLDNLLSTAQTETADIDQFAPIQEREECPICLIPLPFSEDQHIYKECCGKIICNGCSYKHMLTDRRNGGDSHSWDDYKCAFCLQKDGQMNYVKSAKKLMKKKNPHAFIAMAIKYKEGDGVFQSDTRALEMYIRAAEIGHARAYFEIAMHYVQGIAVEQNSLKALEYFKVSAKKGDLEAHRALASYEEIHGNNQKSVNHLKVAANAGDKDSMDDLMKAYKLKHLPKEVLNQVLRAFQEANDLTKNKDRDDARDAMARYNDRRR